MKNTETFDFDLPPGATLRGRLFRDPETKYFSGQVLVVDLPGGTAINLGWDLEDSYERGRYEFHLNVQVGDVDVVDCHLPDPENAARIVQILIDHYSPTTAQIK